MSLSTSWCNSLALGWLLAISCASPLLAQSVGPLRIAAGYSHSASITAAGIIATHGENRSGEIGDGTKTTRISPVYLAPPTGKTWAQVTVGDFRSTALTSTGEMYSWGSNGYGQLGDGTLTDHLTPFRLEPPPAGSSWASVAAGYGHTLALCANGLLYVCGDNHYGQLGVGYPTSSSTYKQLISPSGQAWTQVAAGYNFSLALCADGALYTWGSNADGQLGDGTTNTHYQPALLPAPTGKQWTQVAGGFWSTAAVCSDGAIYTWGNNYGGQLGNGTATGQTTPTRLAPPTGQRWVQVAIGYEHMLAICSDGSLYSWGDNYYGQLGDGSNTQRLTPVRVAPPIGKQWVQVAAGAYHSLALASDGQVYSSGYNYSGQLGDGTTTSTNCFVRNCTVLATTPLATTTPQVVAMPNPFTSDIQLKLNTALGAPVSLALYTTLGQCVWQKSYTQLPSTNEVQLHDLATLPTGIYLLQVSTAQGKQSIKLVH